MKPVKPKIGVFSFTSCEGCQLQILNLEEEFTSIIGLIDLVNFREASSTRREDYDIAFIEGSVTRGSEIEGLKRIRMRAGVLIALGACSHLGGVNNLKNLHSRNTLLRTVYGDADIARDTIATKRVSDIVPVDMVIPGCPIDKGEFLRFVQGLLLNINPRLPDYPVCVECRSRANVCLVEKGGWCLGPATRAGCGSICPSYGDECAGCRGILKEANIESLKNILMENGLTADEIRSKFGIFNGLEELNV